MSDAKKAPTAISNDHAGKDWTVAAIPDQTGRRALITGANSGIGYYAALELARKGAHVLLACRSREKGEAALAKLRAEVPGASCEVVLLDLASLASVRRVAEAELRLGLPLDLLINNAGVMAPAKRLETADGFELQFGTNVLGHFALSGLLLPALERAANGAGARPRVVTIASIASKQNARINFDDLQYASGYKPMTSYRQSKLADLIFAFELDRRLRSAGGAAAKIVSVAAHPGVADTNLFQVGEFSAPERAARRIMGKVFSVFLNTGAMGAIPTLFAATSPEALGGGYYGPQSWGESRGGDVGNAKVAAPALDREAAARLWGVCERLSGVDYL